MTREPEVALFGMDNSHGVRDIRHVHVYWSGWLWYKPNKAYDVHNVCSKDIVRINYKHVVM